MMSKTHAEFLAYINGLSGTVIDNDDEEKLKILIMVLDKLKRDFSHLAKYLEEQEGGYPTAFGRVTFDPSTDRFASDYGGTEEDDRVVDTIQGLMQNCNLALALLSYDDPQDAHLIINRTNVIRLHDLGYEVYIRTDVRDGELVPFVYIDIGSMLVEL